MRFALPASSSTICSSLEPGGARGAQRDQERLRLRAVRVVGRVDDLLGRHEAEEAEQVDRAPHGGVEEDACRAGEVTGEPGEVGDAGVRDDQLRLRVCVDEACEVVGDRRQAAATVDEDRHAPLGRDREHRCEPLVVEHELLRARMQLDPARAAVETALGFVDRIFGQVEPDVRDHPPVRASGGLERAVVACAEPGVPVGLVEAEDVAARDPVLVHGRLELFEAPGHPVDVVAEVRVRVEDVGACGQFGAELRLEAREELFCSFERLAHPLNLPMWPIRTQARAPGRGKRAPARRRPTAGRR